VAFGRDGPASNGLIADLNSRLRQHILNVLKAECEAKTEPDGVADDIRRDGWRLNEIVRMKPLSHNGLLSRKAETCYLLPGSTNA
jgi:hypothetical protein